MMMKKKLQIGLIFGGRSGEHEVSLMSARSVLSVLDPAKYDVKQIGISPTGQWFTGEDVLGKLEAGRLLGLEGAVVLPDPSQPGLYVVRDKVLEKVSDIDVFFPLLHGTFGEDGTIQGLFEMAGAGYVGAGVLGSSVGMDKAVFKDVMQAHGIPVVDSLLALRSEIEKDINAVIGRAEALSAYPMFTKPANLGSSVGITKCNTRSDLQEGLMEASLYDRRLVIEHGIAHAREIEVPVWSAGREQLVIVRDEGVVVTVEDREHRDTVSVISYPGWRI